MNELLVLSLQVLLIVVGAILVIRGLRYWLIDRQVDNQYLLTGQVSSLPPPEPLPPIFLKKREAEIIGHYLDKPIYAWVESTTNSRYVFESVAVKFHPSLQHYMVDDRNGEYIVVDGLFVYRKVGS